MNYETFLTWQYECATIDANKEKVRTAKDTLLKSCRCCTFWVYSLVVTHLIWTHTNNDVCLHRQKSMEPEIKWGFKSLVCHSCQESSPRRRWRRETEGLMSCWEVRWRTAGDCWKRSALTTAWLPGCPGTFGSRWLLMQCWTLLRSKSDACSLGNAARTHRSRHQATGLTSG